MKYLIVFFLFFLSCKQSTNEINCKNFKDGVFYIPFNKRIGKSYFIYRLKNNQVEVDSDKNETYLTIKWISDCSYAAYLNKESIEAKNKIDPSIVVDSTIVNFQKIIGDTIFYNATSFFKGDEFNYHGKMIRLGDVPPKDQL